MTWYCYTGIFAAADPPAPIRLTIIRQSNDPNTLKHITKLGHAIGHIATGFMPDVLSRCRFIQGKELPD
jgi:hypothetical protein